MSQEVELFRRGKEVLGKNAGGMIVKLLKAKSNEVAAARVVIEMASMKENSREYVGAAIRGRDRDEMGAAMQPGYGDDWG